MREDQVGFRPRQDCNDHYATNPRIRVQRCQNEEHQIHQHRFLGQIITDNQVMS